MLVLSILYLFFSVFKILIHSSNNLVSCFLYHGHGFFQNFLKSSSTPAQYIRKRSKLHVKAIMFTNDIRIPLLVLFCSRSFLQSCSRSFVCSIAWQVRQCFYTLSFRHAILYDYDFLYITIISPCIAIEQAEVLQGQEKWMEGI